MPEETNRTFEPTPCCCSCEHLTPREVTVLCEVAAGYTNSEISKVLNVSVHTVARYLTSMLGKTGEHSRTALVNRAYRIGLLTMNDEGPQATGRRCLPPDGRSREAAGAQRADAAAGREPSR
jgi:DNA-binding CsgD family transcriptional regulator